MKKRQKRAKYMIKNCTFNGGKTNKRQRDIIVALAHAAQANALAIEAIAKCAEARPMLVVGDNRGW